MQPFQGFPYPNHNQHQPHDHEPPFDVAVRTFSVDGVFVEELTGGAVGCTTPDGRVLEREHHGFVTLGDGAVVSSLAGTERCDVCAAEVVVLASRGQISPGNAVAYCRHRPHEVLSSALSSMRLCPRHQAVFVQDDGHMVVVSPHEAAWLETQRTPAFLLWLKRATAVVGAWLFAPPVPPTPPAPRP